MKLSRQKPVRTIGRQRVARSSAPASSFRYRSQRAERADTPHRQSSTLAKRRSTMLSARYWLRRSGMVIVVIVALICLITLFRVSSDPRIILIDAGNTYALQAPDAYRRAATEQLSSSLWNRNKITIDSAGAANHLRQQFPELAQVTVTLPLVGQRPIYYLEASAPSFVLTTRSGSYVLDSHGKVLLAKASAPPAVIDGLPVLTDQSGATVNIGKQALSSAQVRFIQAVTASFASKQLPVTSLTLPVDKVQQLDVRVEGQAYVIKFDMHDSGEVRQQIGSYMATATMLAKQGITPAQYIDVRVPGRAYYL